MNDVDRMVSRSTDSSDRTEWKCWWVLDWGTKLDVLKTDKLHYFHNQLPRVVVFLVICVFRRTATGAALR